MEELHQNSFTQSINNSPGKVVVRFYADWCPDCRRTEQGWQEIARKHADQLSFFQVNVDAEQELAQQYNVKGIPSFLVFKAGQEINRLYSRDAKTDQQILLFISKQID